MEIFRELNKKGYKHYYGGTIEELDSMDKNNPDLHSEIMQVVMWLYKEHAIWIEVRRWRYKPNTVNTILKKKGFEYVIKNVTVEIPYATPTEAYLEAIKYCLTEIL